MLISGLAMLIDALVGLNDQLQWMDGWQQFNGYDNYNDNDKSNDSLDG